MVACVGVCTGDGCGVVVATFDTSDSDFDLLIIVIEYDFGRFMLRFYEPCAKLPFASTTPSKHLPITRQHSGVIAST